MGMSGLGFRLAVRNKGSLHPYAAKGQYMHTGRNNHCS